VAETRDGFPSTGKLAGTFLWERIINGPVRSRRLGVSLGLNILPPRSKLCTFDCPYCECGFNSPKAPGERWPSPDVVADAVRKTLGFMREDGGRRTEGRGLPDWLTFAGNGEPTMHPRFPVVVDRVLAARDEAAPGLKVGILSNGLAAGKPAIRDALNRLDARMMKLDPGPARAVSGVEYDRALLVERYRGLRDVIVQAMFVEGPGFSGAAEEAVAEWLGWLARIEPAGVHIYSIMRTPADSRIKAVARDRLLEIADRARQMVPGSVAVF
jgi:wyosine [tRNA(Phe)-imidazoG37] synthetase (radical SAM superfamily)